MRARFARIARRAIASLLAALVVYSVGLALSRSRLVSPEPSVLLLDRNGRFLGEVSQEKDTTAFGYWPLDEIPPRVADATLALEDRRFWSHPGVDPIAVFRAAWQNISSGTRVSGASTIAMQVARLQNPGSRTYWRKSVESLTAVFLTLRYGREAVLLHYLRTVPYGNRIHGIAYAARCYLAKPVSDLSWAEIAFLSAIPQAPSRMNPFTSDGRRAAEARGRRILDALKENGVLSVDEYELASDQIGRLRIPERGSRPRVAMHAVLRLSDDFRTNRPAHALLVQTTLDLDLQEEVTWTAMDAIHDLSRQGASNAAVIVVGRDSNEVLAWMGATDYFDGERAGAIDYTGVPRSSGSTLKPFLYALALDKGTITAASVLDDLPRGTSAITNADKRYMGPMLPRAALGNSRNVPAADVLDMVGIDNGYELLGELGLHDNDRSGRHYGLGLAMGTLPVTLEKLVSAYTVLADDGRYRDLVWYRGQPVSPSKRVLSENAARQVSMFLSDPMARLPTFPRMGVNEYSFPVAVKTGTSSNYRDAWTVAYSSKYLVGVWVGRPDHRPMHRLSGYRAASPLARKVLLHLHREDTDGLEDLSFPSPRTARVTKLCALTGERATDACERVSAEWLAPGQEPVNACGAHLRLAVDRRSGGLANAATPKVDTEVRTFVELSPRYASWASAAGLPRPPLTVSMTPAVPELPPSFAQSSRVRVALQAPEDGLTLWTDPETPSGMATLALRAVVDPPAEQVVWYVDGEPFEVVRYPYVARWRVSPGEHSFQVRLPHTDISSAIARVRVQ